MPRDLTKLTTGPIASTLFAFTVPILLGNVLQSLNGSVNAIWIGRYLGPAALTAASNVNAILFLLMGGAFGVSMAATILVGQDFGARRFHEARRVVGASAIFFVSASVTLALIGVVADVPLLALMHTPSDALPYARDYLRIILGALPFIYLYTYVMAILRGAGDSKTPFKFLLLSVGLDIALNPLLIFGWGPVPAMGIAGSALATLIANATSLVGLLAVLYRRHDPLCLKGADLSLLRFDGTIIGTLLRKGLPMGLQMIVISLNIVMIITLVNQFGSDTTAAYGAVWQLWTYVQMPTFALAAAVSAMSAQNVGAKRWDRVKAIARTGVLFSCIGTGVIAILLALVDRYALTLFLSKLEIIDIARHINRIGLPSFVFFGISMALFAVVRATGAVLPPLLILVISLWGFRLPFAWLVSDRIGAEGIWWSFPLAAALSALMALLYYRFGGWRSAHMMTEPTP